MSLISYNCRNQYLFASNILHCFRNVMKLKGPTMNRDSRLNPLILSRTFIKSVAFNISPPADVLCNRHLFKVSQTYRWTRCSKTGFFMNTYSKKKNKRTQFEERLKFQTNKLRETKRRFKKTIVDIKENVLTIPNGLCVIRIFSTPVLAYLIFSECYSASLGLFVFAGFTDLIDGYIARNFPNQQSMIGSFLDPAADKLLIATLFISLTMNGLIPVPLTSVILLRDVCLMSAGFYIRYVSLPPPKTLYRYFDMSLITAKLQPTTLSKANTLIQISVAAASLAAPVFCFVDHLCLHILWYITGTTTVLSAASYIYYKKSTYKLFDDADRKNNNSSEK